ncbi:MAG: ATP synthase F1 subunit epsilon [Alphaproteobacteria bacterium]|nr:ATP synthase F1 subunit epsilon [Alphaproteobacteria bacterium]
MSINFELVSPEEKLVSEPVYMAVIPGITGEMGVGKDHASFVVALQAGVVKLFASEGDKAPRKIFIAGGFADITGENCTVLAEQAVNVNELDKKAVEQELKDLNEDLGRAADDTERKRVQKAIKLVNAKLTAVTE